MGVSFVSIFEKIDRVITAPHCTLSAKGDSHYKEKIAMKPGASVTPCIIECYSNLKSDANIVWHKPCQNRPNARKISQIPVWFWHIMACSRLLIFEQRLSLANKTQYSLPSFVT